MQIRDLKTHLPLEGIEIGDIGRKIAFSNVDNGYMKFDHYKVPRSALLSRYVSIDAAGNFTVQSPDQ